MALAFSFYIHVTERMKSLYNRIYYTIYRALLAIGQSEESDMLRVNVFILISLFTMLIAVGIVSLLITISDKVFIVNSKTASIFFSLAILGLNAYTIFYKNRYQKIESNLSKVWAKEKHKNIAITFAFIVFAISFICWSVYILKIHAS